MYMNNVYWSTNSNVDDLLDLIQWIKWYRKWDRHTNWNLGSYIILKILSIIENNVL
jgi:hypothetical protein